MTSMTPEQYAQATQRALEDIVTALHESLPLDNQGDVRILSSALVAMGELDLPEEALEKRLRAALEERIVATVGDVLERTRWSSPFFFLLWLVDAEPPEDLSFLSSVSDDDMVNDQLFTGVARILADVFVETSVQKFGVKKILHRVARSAKKMEEAFDKNMCVTSWDQVRHLLIEAESIDDKSTEKILSSLAVHLKSDESRAMLPRSLHSLIDHAVFNLTDRMDVIAERMSLFEEALHEGVRCSNLHV